MDGLLTLKDFTSCEAEIASVEQTDSNVVRLTPFLSVLDECDAVIICDNEMSGIVFIAGYVGYKLKGKLECIECRVELLTERALECDYPCDDSFDYLSSADRGRLTWPTDLMVDIVVQTVTVFKCLVSPKNVKEISMVNNQRSILTELALKRCEQVTDTSRLCATCGKDMNSIMQKGIKVFSNICLNNYTKHLADGITKSKTLRKLSTFVK